MKWHLAALVAATVVSATGLGIAAAGFDPFAGGAGVKVLFYNSLFLTCWGLGAVLAALLQKPKKANDLYIPLRRGFLLALMLVSYSLLARVERFTTVSAIISLGILALAELIAVWRAHKASRLEDFS